MQAEYNKNIAKIRESAAKERERFLEEQHLRKKKYKMRGSQGWKSRKYHIIGPEPFDVGAKKIDDIIEEKYG